MNGFDRYCLATIIRGIYINATGTSWIVLYQPPGDPGQPAEDGAEFSPDVIWVDISSALANDDFDEEVAAKIFTEAFAAWEFERAPSGVEALEKTATVKKLPSRVVVKNRNRIAAFYWIDRSIDAAKERISQGRETLFEIPLSAPPREPSGRDHALAPGMSAALRGEVVKDRIALVTGGAQGFGEEIVRGLAASGALVFIADLNLGGAEKLAAGINAAAKKTAAIPVAVNVSDEASVEELFRTVAETAGGLDLCISNAGVLRAGSVLEQDLGEFKFVTDINYTGFFIVAKHAGRLFRRQHRTAPNWKTDIIQINSKSGLEGSNKNGAYAGGKFGGIGLTASFALELVEYNIKVNAICPGNFFDGPLWSDPEKGLFVQYLKAGKVARAKTVADVKAFYESKVPMKRGCTGADVMRAIYYIVEQEYETGQAIPVTGGQVMLH
ncbi:MAG: SDR family NAD(P)-dependent oxidoreductase [Spirochaetaceae bacterium]|jgi:sorbitol-6-phosphate 2-dehydrogenase|nr:SDR family NAD(P)-dependent oxidoreductase [Spirochaetaceae bacterium]